MAFLRVMRSAVMFCPVVGAIGVSWAPEVPKLLLRFATPKPMEAHIHRFRSAQLNIVFDDAEGRAVVSLHRGGWLLVPHFFEDLSLWNGLARVDVQSAKFRLCGG